MRPYADQLTERRIQPGPATNQTTGHGPQAVWRRRGGGQGSRLPPEN